MKRTLTAVEHMEPAVQAGQPTRIAEAADQRSGSSVADSYDTSGAVFRHMEFAVGAEYVRGAVQSG